MYLLYCIIKFGINSFSKRHYLKYSQSTVLEWVDGFLLTCYLLSSCPRYSARIWLTSQDPSPVLILIVFLVVMELDLALVFIRKLGGDTVGPWTRPHLFPAPLYVLPKGSHSVKHGSKTWLYFLVWIRALLWQYQLKRMRHFSGPGVRSRVLDTLAKLF